MAAPPEGTRKQVSSGLLAAAREAEAEERLDDRKNSDLLSAAAKNITSEVGDETAHILRQLSSEIHQSEEKRTDNEEVSQATADSTSRRGMVAEDKEEDVARALRSAAQEVVREEETPERSGDHAEDTYGDGNIDVSNGEYESSSDEGGSEGSAEEEEVDTEKDKELIQCCARGDSSRVSKLLRGGARLLCADGHGWTPMHWAVSRGHIAVMRELLDACPNNRLKRLVNAKDRLSGWTPLHVAVVAGHLPCVKLLLENSAKAYSKNSMGETPRDCIPFERASTEYKDMVSALGPQPSRRNHQTPAATTRIDASNSRSGGGKSTAERLAQIAGNRK